MYRKSPAFGPLSECPYVLAAVLGAAAFFPSDFATRGGLSTLKSALHFLQNRDLPPSADTRTPIRVALLHEPHTINTLEISIGISLLSLPPC